MIYIIIIFIIVILFIIGLFIGNYFYAITLNRKDKWYKKQGRKMIYANDSEQGGEITKTSNKQNAKVDAFYRHKDKQEIYLTSFDGLKLFGNVFIENKKSHKWAICMHGYRSNGKADVGYVAYELSLKGFNTVIPDQRGHGKSAGNYIGMGWHERFDVISWINYVLEIDNKAEIILMGGSMGAATVLNASGEELPKNVKLIIADCGYSSASKEFDYLIKNALGIKISKPIIFFANIITLFKAKYSLYKASPEKQLKKNRLPILFIHGLGDTFVPPHMTEDNMHATISRKEVIFIPDAVHFSSYVYDPKEYFDTIFNFIDKNM